MDFRVELSDRAQRDIAAIYDWLLSQKAGDAGERWFAALNSAIASLATLPSRCSLAPENRASPVELRQLLYGRRSHTYRILLRSKANRSTCCTSAMYDVASAGLHSRNPFNPQTSLELKYDFPEWVERIRKLLRIHFMHFVDDRRWLVYVPDIGKIQVFTVMSDPSVT